MSLIQIDHNPSRRELGVFGFVWLAFFGIVGGIVLSNSDSLPATAVIWSVAAIVPVVGWMMPALMRVVYVGLAYAAFPIGFVVSHVILLAIFYLVLTPLGLLMRLSGYDPMSSSFDAEATTYWCPRDKKDSLEEYFRQF